jgi:hypothetical protein
MSANKSIDLRQDRREWLKTAAAALGASILPIPRMEAETPQGQVAPAEPHAKSAGTQTGRFFNPSQHRLVEELSETILPADSHAGGAKAAKVADYIEQVVNESTDDIKKTLWSEGLRLVDLMSQHYNGAPFVESSSEGKIAVLTVLSDNEQMTDLPEVRFFRELKRLTISGYYTSKIGIHDELEYKGNRILQEYVGCDDQGTTSS